MFAKIIFKKTTQGKSMRQQLSKITLAVLSATSLTFAASVAAQETEAEAQAKKSVEVIQVTGTVSYTHLPSPRDS